MTVMRKEQASTVWTIQNQVQTTHSAHYNITVTYIVIHDIYTHTNDQLLTGIPHYNMGKKSGIPWD